MIDPDAAVAEPAFVSATSNAPLHPTWEELLAAARDEVRLTLTDLPADLRAAAEPLPVVYQPRPDRAMRRSGIAADTLGLFVGPPFADTESAHGQVPPQILLFLENILLEADGDPDLFREEVRTTYLHELGHYLGLDESGLEERGLL